MHLTVDDVHLKLRKGLALVRDNRVIGNAEAPTTLAALGRCDEVPRKPSLIRDMYSAARIQHIAAQ